PLARTGSGNGVRAVGPALPGLAEHPLGHGATELEEEPGAVVRVLEDVVEGGDEVVDLLLAADEGGEKLDDVDVVGGDLREDAMPVEKGHEDHLGEDGR